MKKKTNVRKISRYKIANPTVNRLINELVGPEDVQTPSEQVQREMITTILKLKEDEIGLGDLKLMNTTLKELRLYAGKESKYFVITGAEVIDLLPTGYGFVLDMEGDHRMVFDAKAVEQMVDFAMRRMYG